MHLKINFLIFFPKFKQKNIVTKLNIIAKINPKLKKNKKQFS